MTVQLGTIYPQGDPRNNAPPPIEGIAANGAPGASPDAWSGDSDTPPGAGKTGAPAGDPFATDADHPAEAKPPARQVGTGEALGRGIVAGAGFGLGPAVAGLSAAAGKDWEEKDIYGEEGNPLAPFVGAFKLLHDKLTGGAPPEGTEAQQSYERGRQAALADENLVREQQPKMYLAGQLAGTLMAPIPGMGLARGAALGTRIARGAAQGSVAGAAYGGGNAVSQGQDLPGVATAAGTGALGGAVLGGALHGVIGPRPVNPSSAGQRAAATAEALGTPIPKGVASDSRALQSTTSAAASVPLLGARIRNQVDAARQAAGEQVAQSGVDDAIAANRAHVNHLYDDVRGQINPDQVMSMPATQVAVARVRAARGAARHPNPDQGLEQFDNIAQQGASFNGAHRARVDARDAGDALSPHPGYNAADYNQITRAMTQDMRVNLYRQGGPAAVRSFDRAERNFGPISTANKFLARIARARGPGAGLDEIGFNPATGEFSLDKFVTAWNKLNPEARPFVPAPGHARNIQDIFQLGTHLKSAMREKNTSHTSTPLIMWDLARDAVMTGAAVATGMFSGASVLGSAAASAPVIILMHWLASPARAASMSAWGRAYQVLTLGQPTPARIGAFNIATRNLANTLGVKVEDVLRAAHRQVQAVADPDQQQQ